MRSLSFRLWNECKAICACREGGQWLQPLLQTTRHNDPVHSLGDLHGLVKTGHYPWHRRREFLDFMNEIVATHPGSEIHVFLHNSNTHKPKAGRWLQRHSHVHFHFTPTYSSWLNQVECWFSILTRLSFAGCQFHIASTAPAGDRRFGSGLQSEGRTVRVEEGGRVCLQPEAELLYLCKQVLALKAGAGDFVKKPFRYRSFWLT